MQKNRNRSVKNNFEFPIKFLESLPDVETIQSNIKTSGTGQSQDVQNKDLQAKDKERSTFSFDRDSLTNESDLDIVSFGKSSSSSISWSDDFDTEATKRVQIEFERMERILQGKEPIPLHYNKDEYQQWINTFPQLSVIGNKIGCSSVDYRNVNESNKDFEEVFAYQYDNDYLTPNDKSLSSADLKKISDIKNKAVEKIFQKISNKFINASSVRTKDITNNNKKLEYKTSKLYVPKTNNHLIHKEPLNKPSTLNKRQELPLVTKSKHLSKWVYQSSMKYSSLPLIKCANNKTNKPFVQNQTSSISRHSSNASPYRSNCVSLPPIKTLNIPPVHQYRSISTTPRNVNKTLISASTPVQAKHRKPIKYNFEVSKFEQEKSRKKNED